MKVDKSLPERVQYWDIAKGIAIILMVIGHTDMPILLKGAIFSFHMPFFIIANGYFIKSYDMKRTFWRSIHTLLVPYVIICMVSAVIYMMIGNGSWSVSQRFFFRVRAMIGGMSKCSTKFQDLDSVWLVWFVCSLFITRNLYVLLVNICKGNKPLLIGSICVLAVLGYCIGEYYAYMPWSLDIALVSLTFIAIGDWMRQHCFFDKKLLPKWLLSMVIWSGILLLTRDHIELAMREYPYGILSIMSATAGSIILIIASEYLERIPGCAAACAWMGRNSMIILGIHNTEMMYWNWEKWVFAYIPLEMNWITLSIAKVIVILILTAVLAAGRDNVVSFLKKRTAARTAVS